MCVCFFFVFLWGGGGGGVQNWQRLTMSKLNLGSVSLRG